MKLNLPSLRDKVRRYKRGIAAAIVVFAVAWSAFLVRDALGQGTIPFGGKVSSVRMCTCDPGVSLLSVGPPANKKLLYDPKNGSIPYQYYQFYRAGVYLLGRYKKTDATCRYVCTGGCCEESGDGLMTIVGTSR